MPIIRLIYFGYFHSKYAKWLSGYLVCLSPNHNKDLVFAVLLLSILVIPWGTDPSGGAVQKTAPDFGIWQGG